MVHGLHTVFTPQKHDLQIENVQAILTSGWDFEAIQHLLNLGCFFGSRSILKKSELLRPQRPQEIWRDLKASEWIWWPWGSSPLCVLHDWVRDMVHDLLVFLVHMTIRCEAYPWLNNHGWWVNPIRSNGKRFVNMYKDYCTITYNNHQ